MNPKRIEAAKNNARVYGVEHKIEFMEGSFLEIGPTLKADGVLLAPPWCADIKEYMEMHQRFDLPTMTPYTGDELFKIAREISNNIAFYISPFAKVQQVSSSVRSGYGFQ